MPSSTVQPVAALAGLAALTALVGLAGLTAPAAFCELSRLAAEGPAVGGQRTVASGAAATHTMTTIEQLNTCEADAFVALVGPVFERSPWIAAAVVDQRPFASRAQLHAALCDAVRTAGSERQLALIRAHPDLVGRLVLTAESAREQAAAGLTDLAPEDIAAFDRYNSAYMARFGFPFVICARKNKKEAILRAFPVRLAHGRDEEIATALDEIFQIAALRLDDLLP